LPNAFAKVQAGPRTSLIVTDAASHVTYHAYDTEDNLTGITDANRNKTAFTYDAFGRVTKTNFPSLIVDRRGERQRQDFGHHREWRQGQCCRDHEGLNTPTGVEPSGDTIWISERGARKVHPLPMPK
jgi:YD repeat-containing protein